MFSLLGKRWANKRFQDFSCTIFVRITLSFASLFILSLFVFLVVAKFPADHFWLLAINFVQLHPAIITSMRLTDSQEYSVFQLPLPCISRAGVKSVCAQSRVDEIIYAA
nr:uncharacterized protein LOC104119887 isoform X1 [Nicotiana tomentosiformis]